ncbi:hypothetical protein BBBR_0348 [Bifidobacterium breve DSM 20213 = JCM 1192]|nr:hypothetical protein BBBR_0348 [Bifidobacterium breve DSM 20213 = JCM 1192]
MYARGSLGRILADVSRHIKEAVRRAYGGRVLWVFNRLSSVIRKIIDCCVEKRAAA